MIDTMDVVDKWHLARFGKFTASMIYKLNTPGKSVGGFDSYGETYIQDKVIERLVPLYQRPELENVEPLIHGKSQEAAAIEAYKKETKNYNLRHFGEDNPIYLPFNDYSGGSPDALMGEGEKIYLVCEIKNPFNPKNHYKYCSWKNQYDLKEGRKEYYAQIQFLLMITQADEAHFVSYDNRFLNKAKQLKIIQVKPDPKFQDNLEIRLRNAEKEVQRLIQEFNQ